MRMNIIPFPSSTQLSKQIDKFHSQGNVFPWCLGEKGAVGDHGGNLPMVASVDLADVHFKLPDGPA